MADDNNTFSKLSDDVVLNIFSLLEHDPRNWARLSCVCRKFSSLISTVCCKSKCISTFPSLTADLLSLPSTSSASPPGGWSSLYKIAVCCPGLRHSGVLLDNSDFGLLRELGPDEDYHHQHQHHHRDSAVHVDVTTRPPEPRVVEGQSQGQGQGQVPETWTLYDDLYFDTVYDNSETTTSSSATTTTMTTTTTTITTTTMGDPMESGGEEEATDESEAKKRKVSLRLLRSHLASGVWSLSREQGNKLLASRFREDCLYLCDWPGCVHMEDKRNYMLFRGVFKNFKRSRVWRTINDGHRSKIDLNCAFCTCLHTWDLHSAFCLKRGFGFHDDGQPVVRAYVCDNGHVSGAWTDLPLYS